jgi:ABC-type nitrate/sulfonate/bicarbonate transport system permease component
LGLMQSESQGRAMTVFAALVVIVVVGVLLYAIVKGVSEDPTV